MIKRILLAAIIALPVCAFAQKFGVVNADAILQNMPEIPEIQKKLTDASQKFEAEFKNLQDEMQKKYEEFQKLDKDATQPQAIKERRMTELQDLDKKIQEFRANATQQLQKQQADLMQPVQERVLKAIQAVGQKNGYTFILQNEIPVFVGSDVTDVTPLVKAELGVK